MEKASNEVNNVNGISSSKRKVFFTLATISLGVILSLLFTPFFKFKVKYTEGLFLPLSFLVKSDIDLKGWYLIESSIAIFAILMLIFVIAFILFVKSAIGVKKNIKKAEICAQKIVFLSLIITSVYYVASLCTACFCSSLLKVSVSTTDSFIPLIVAIVAFFFCAILKSSVVKRSGDKFYFHNKRGKQLGFYLTILLTIIIIGLTVVGLAQGENIDGIVCIPVSIVLCVLFCIKFNMDINTEDYRVYIQTKENEGKENVVLDQRKEQGRFNVGAPKRDEITNKLLCISYEAGKNETYGEFASLIDLVVDFVDFAKANGVEVDTEDAVNLFSAMASTRAIWVNGDSLSYLKALINVLKRYFGGVEGIFEINEDCLTEKDVVESFIEQGERKLNFVEEIYRAKIKSGSVNLSAFTNVSEETIEKFFPTFVKYFRAPEYGDGLYVGYFAGINEALHLQNSEFDLSMNWWCFFINADKEKTLGKESEQYITSITIKEKLVFPTTQTERSAPISLHDFLYLFEKAVDNNFVALDIWNKFDKIVDYLQSTSDFVMTNHIYRQIESFTSVLVACGEDNVKAIDRILSYKILPCYAKSNISKKEAATLTECVDRVFGLDNMSLTAKAIINLGIDR